MLAAGAFSIAAAFSAHPDWSKSVAEAGRDTREFTTRTIASADRDVLRPASRWVAAEGHFVASGVARPGLKWAGHVLAALETDILSTSRGASATAHAGLHRAANPASHPNMRAVLPPARAVPAPPASGGDELAQTKPAQPVAPTDSAPAADGQVARAADPDEAKHRLPEPTLALADSEARDAARAGGDATLSQASTTDSADVIRVQERLKDNLTHELYENFELFLYVSKANTGPWAQRMYVFQKQPSGDLSLLYNWPVSTGREQVEFNPAGRRLRTVTPEGYYELDPDRSYEHYRSHEWGKSMPYAMFFNWIRHGDQTGLAIHAASGDDVALLGKRASAGCIHLSLDDAHTLYALIRSHYRGLAPRFAIDRRTGTMSNQGIMLHDASGNVKMAEGYKVLIFIENYGGENVVAALF